VLEEERTEGEMVLDTPYHYTYESAEYQQPASYENRIADDTVDIKLEQVYMDEEGLFLYFKFSNLQDKINVSCLNATLITESGSYENESDLITYHLPTGGITFGYVYFPFTPETAGNEVTVTLHTTFFQQTAVGEWHIPVGNGNVLPGE